MATIPQSQLNGPVAAEAVAPELMATIMRVDHPVQDVRSHNVWRVDFKTFDFEQYVYKITVSSQPNEPAVTHCLPREIRAIGRG